MNKRFIGVLIFAFIVATAGGVLTYRSLINRAPAVKAVPAGRPRSCWQRATWKWAACCAMET